VREDAFTNTEADAAHFAAIAGRDEDFGGGPGDQGVSPLDRVDAQTSGPGPDPWDLPDPKPATPLDLPAEPPF
jgi:hypothetical protein